MSNIETGRPDKYDDVLVQMHESGWFSFSALVDAEHTRETGRVIDGVRETETVTIKEKVARPHIYDNLTIIPDKDGVTHDKPTKDYLDTELAKLQAEFDAKDYARKRVGEYPTVGDQLDMIYHDQVNSTTTFKDAVKAVKDKYPKS